jgi:hypothetical protein
VFAIVKHMKIKEIRKIQIFRGQKSGERDEFSTNRSVNDYADRLGISEH